MSMWDAVDALSSAVGTLIVAGALVFTALQVREARHTRAITSLLVVHKEYLSPELNEVRRRLRGVKGAPYDFAQLSEEDDSGLGDLLLQMELVGFLVARGLVDVTDAISLFPRLPTTFVRVLPYIELRRQTAPEYALMTEALVGRYQEHHGRLSRTNRS